MALYGLQTSAQTTTIETFNGYGIIGLLDSTTVNGGDYTVTIPFRNDSGKYSADSVSIGDFIWDTKCDRYMIVHINDTSPFLEAEVTTQNSNGAPPAVGGGNALIYRPTPNYGYMPSLSKLNNTLRDCIDNHRINELDTDIYTASQSGGGGVDSFDFNRPILRLPLVGTTVGVQTIEEYFEWQFFTAPTLALTLAPTTTVYEVGDTATINLVTNITNPASAVLTLGVLLKTVGGTVDTITNIGTTAGDVTSIFYEPTQDSLNNFKRSAYSFQSRQTYNGAGESGVVNSNTRSISAVYPVLYGVSATDLTVSGDAYTTLTKLVQTEGNKSVVMDGSGFIYYAVPSTWTDVNLSSIIDANGFNVTPSFTSSTIAVTSSGLANNWSINYTIYKLNNLTTINNGTYTFNR